MDGEFPTSPSKRRRTESPLDAAMSATPISIPGLHLSEPATAHDAAEEPVSATVEGHVEMKEAPRETRAETGPDLLNMLMMQVEAQARDQGQNYSVEPAVDDFAEWKQQEAQQLASEMAETLQGGEPRHESVTKGTMEVDSNTAQSTDTAQGLKTGQEEKTEEPDPSTAFDNPFGSKDAQGVTVDVQSTSLVPAPATDPKEHISALHAQLNVVQQPSTDPLPASDSVAQLPVEKEWETDSSPYSSTDSSSDSDSDSDAESDGQGQNDYALLSPAEQARMLMDEAGSDDEGHKSKTAGGVVKTANEKIEEVIPKPDIVVTSEMRVEELGFVEAIVENTVLIRGRTTGEYQVLESGSLLCLKDRSVIGVVADTMGRVDQPLYTVRFTNNEAIAEAGVAEKATTIYYVHEHSTFVFTQPLKGLKGSDASNFHDEEVGDEEMEFSDDEKEAEHRRLLKLRKRGIDVDSVGGRAGSGGTRGNMQGRGGRGRGRGRGRGGFQLGQPTHPENAMPNANETMSLNYDDGEATEYEPLRRPKTMENQELPQQNGYQQPENTTPKFQQHEYRRSGNQRGRGQNNRGRGNRGNFQQDRNLHQGSYQHNGYHQQQPQQLQQSHDFNQQQHQQQSWMPPIPPPPGVPNFFNPSMMPGAAASFNFNYQQQSGYGHQQNGYGQLGYQQPNSYGQQQNAHGQQNQSYGGGAWANNQAAADQVQKQLQELRRQAQQQQGGPNYGG